MLQGRRLAHFELIEPIGVGGMAAVIRARDTQLDRSVALKILPPEMATDPENVRRFHQEARAAAKLDHENIARVFFCGEDQKLHFIAFEFVEGENLRTILEHRGRLSVADAVRYTLQVTAGLAHAASRGVVHRDIKPSNIIITSDGRAKLVDMGLARSLEPHGDNALTQSGVTLGTFDYISPEQALEPREADVRSDIYSLGCTFYHMLTGNPPVPEGTAAKKLHHHQHEPPVDPRQLNPEVPDEVAAVLVRMMAKDPKSRYQQPEQLEQHLLLLAQKLGIAPNLPARLPFVENALPGPPRVHPLVLAAVAGLAVIALIVVLGPSWQSQEQPNQSPQAAPVTPRANFPGPDSASVGPQPRPTDPGKGDSPPTVKPIQTVHRIAATEQELADALKEPDVEVLLTGGKTYDLKKLLEGAADASRRPGLVFNGDKLALKPAEEGGPRPVIKLDYDAVTPGVQSALTVKKGLVTIEGVRFEIDGLGASEIFLAAVAREGGRVTIRDCDFAQLSPRAGLLGLLSSVRVSASPADKKDVVALENCCFVAGQDAVTLTGPAVVSASNCTFGRHAAIFHHYDGGTKPGEASLTVRKCYAFLMDGPAFHLDGDTGCLISAQDCCFSRPEDVGVAESSGILLLQTGDLPRGLRYRGDHNRYHNLQAFWKQTSILGKPIAITTLDAFKDKLELVERDVDSMDLGGVSPWQASNPLQLLESATPRMAFVVDESRLPPFRDRKSPEVAQRTLTVDPEVAQPRAGVYRDLGQAVVDARAGDVIEIRSNGEVRVAPVRLDRSGIDLTIRAAKDYHPILTLGETRDSEVALFRIHDGQLRLEQLEFRLRPRERPTKGGQKESQAVVSVGDVGQCTFKQCVVTLAAEDIEEARFAVVTLVNPKDVMKMGQPGRRTVPEVHMDGCFVRGKGDLVAVPVSRPFDFEAKQSLIALAGSLFSITGKSEDQPATTPLTSIRLAHLTTYLTEHLVLVRANPDDGKGGRGLVPTEITAAEDCLFVSARGKSLIHLEGVDGDEAIRKAFAWRRGWHNAYSGFTDFLDQQPKDSDSNRMMPVQEDKWPEFTHDMVPAPLFLKLKWTVAADLARVLPAEFKTKRDDLQGYGADIEVLPQPATALAVGPVAPGGK
jgi:serine/threonine protein kinase